MGSMRLPQQAAFSQNEGTINVCVCAGNSTIPVMVRSPSAFERRIGKRFSSTFFLLIGELTQESP
jgi:hypothetical protein